ncbi:MAG: histidine phosphatase family protein [Candidatus Baltobacteraceae bacterium]
MPIVRIARHAETTWNAVGRYQGRIDAPLSPLGQAQAQALARALREKNIGRIISSPLSRAVHTALPLSLVTNVPVETDPLLLEIAHGTWEGRYREEIAQTEPVLYWEWREHPERVAFPAGESLGSVAERWNAFARGFRPHADTLIVTHDVVVRLAILAQTGREQSGLRDVRALNAAYARFQVDGAQWRMQADCVVDHLGGLAADAARQAL